MAWHDLPTRVWLDSSTPIHLCWFHSVLPCFTASWHPSHCIHCLHVVARTCSLYSSAQLMLGFDGDTVGAVDEVIAGRDGVLKC